MVSTIFLLVVDLKPCTNCISKPLRNINSYALFTVTCNRKRDIRCFKVLSNNIKTFVSD